MRGRTCFVSAGARAKICAFAATTSWAASFNRTVGDSASLVRELVFASLNPNFLETAASDPSIK